MSINSVLGSQCGFAIATTMVMAYEHKIAPTFVAAMMILVSIYGIMIVSKE